MHMQLLSIERSMHSIVAADFISVFYFDWNRNNNNLLQCKQSKSAHEVEGRIYVHFLGACTVHIQTKGHLCGLRLAFGFLQLIAIPYYFYCIIRPFGTVS